MTSVANLLLDIAPLLWGVKAVIFLLLSLSLSRQDHHSNLGVWITRMFLAVALSSLGIAAQTLYLALELDATDLDRPWAATMAVATALPPILVAWSGVMVMVWQRRIWDEVDEQTRQQMTKEYRS